MTAAVILAAGESRRMGRPKAFLPFRHGTFLSILAETCAPFCAPVIAVFGHRGEALSALAPPGVRPVVNPNYTSGMLTSLQAGLAALDPEGFDLAGFNFAGFDRVLFTLVDHPAVSPQTIAALLDSRAEIAIPRFNGRRGHPVVIRASIAREFLLEPAASKVRDVIERHPIHYIDVPDRGIADDIDDPELYAALLAREALPA